MIYARVVFADGAEGIREVSASGQLLRYCDANGNDIGRLNEYPEIHEQVNPAWAQADPVPAPDPVPAVESRVITKLAYMNRFTDAELATIFTVSKTEVAVEIWLEKFKVAEFVDLADPVTQGGVNALESFGLIGAGRAGEILA